MRRREARRLRKKRQDPGSFGFAGFVIKKQEINDAFATKEITDQRLAEFYFQRNNVVYSFKDYFSFGDLNESFNYIPQVTIPNSEFKKYLKPNSILNNLIN